MEKLSEILNNIKDRLSNPLIFSFLLSWLIYNWRIPVALIRYDKSQFSDCGCHTIFDFISYQYYATEGSIRFPIIFALLYTIISPFVKSGIKLLNTRVTKFTDDKELGILDGGKISVNKYLELRSQYKEKTIELVKIIEEQSDERNKSRELEKNNELLIAEKAELNNKLFKSRDSDFMDGKWSFKITPLDFLSDIVFDVGNKPKVHEYKISIKNREISELKVGNEQLDKYFISNFYYSENEKIIIFKKILRENYVVKANDYLENTKLVFLNVQNDGSGRIKLVGKENYEDVEYLKLEI